MGVELRSWIWTRTSKVWGVGKRREDGRTAREDEGSRDEWGARPQRGLRVGADSSVRGRSQVGPWDVNRRCSRVEGGLVLRQRDLCLLGSTPVGNVGGEGTNGQERWEAANVAWVRE